MFQLASRQPKDDPTRIEVTEYPVHRIVSRDRLPRFARASNFIFHSPISVAAFASKPSGEKKTMHHDLNHLVGHGLLAWIFIGVVAGWVTGKIMKGSGYGVFVDMFVGLVGALVGGYISSYFGFGGVSEHGLVGSILIAVLGAVLLTVLLRMIFLNRRFNF
jgi:uncharacterized membrane protein YeaQ/YmgE (transglycosylase-associated protein family)